MPKRQKSQPLTRGQEFIGLIGGLFGGYIAAELALAHFAHMYHWLVAGLSAGGGYYGVLAGFKYKIPARFRRVKAVPSSRSRRRR